MKRSVRPLLSVLLLFAVAATLTFRVVVHRGSIQLEIDGVFVEAPAKPVFNATIVNFAAADIAEPQLKREIEELLEGKFENRGRRRSFLSSGRYHIDIRARSARGIPVQLRSPQFYRVWLEFRRHLQIWSRNRKFQPDAMSSIGNAIKAFIDRSNDHKKSGKRYSSCAVVGNSGILLKGELGKLIDSHEFVIRLNNARIGGFERNVGSKTSISFVNSNILHLCARREGCFCHPYGPTVPMIMYICQPVHFLDYTICNSSHKAPLLITDAHFDVLCARIVKYYSAKRFVAATGKALEEWGAAHDGVNFHYSSGMQAVMFAVGICDRVSIFGFGKSDAAKHHYHTNQKAELRLHDYEAEYDLYRDLVEKPQVIPFLSDKFKFPPVALYQ